jgi:hypothetical protein
MLSLFPNQDMAESRYIHGSRRAEQAPLATLNALVNPSFLKFLQLDGARSIR